jgi:hypothetical protein
MFRKIEYRVAAKSAGSGEPVCTVHTGRWMRYCTESSFEAGDFLAEKGLATFSLGLIRHSMALSQLQSRDTVPLICVSGH